MTFLSLFKL